MIVKDDDEELLQGGGGGGSLSNHITCRFYLIPHVSPPLQDFGKLVGHIKARKTRVSYLGFSLVCQNFQ